MKTRRILQSERWLLDATVKISKTICFSPFLSTRPGAKQSFGRSGSNNSSNISVANAILVPSVTETIDMKPFTFASNPKSLGRCEQRIPSLSGKRKLATPGMSSFKQKLFKEVISKGSASLILDA